jgi:hypothetical protein
VDRRIRLYFPLLQVCFTSKLGGETISQGRQSIEHLGQAQIDRSAERRTLIGQLHDEERFISLLALAGGTWPISTALKHSLSWLARLLHGRLRLAGMSTLDGVVTLVRAHLWPAKCFICRDSLAFSSQRCLTFL